MIRDRKIQSWVLMTILVGSIGVSLTAHGSSVVQVQKTEKELVHNKSKSSIFSMTKIVKSVGSRVKGFLWGNGSFTKYFKRRLAFIATCCVGGAALREWHRSPIVGGGSFSGQGRFDQEGSGLGGVGGAIPEGEQGEPGAGEEESEEEDAGNEEGAGEQEVNAQAVNVVGVVFTDKDFYELSGEQVGEGVGLNNLIRGWVGFLEGRLRSGVSFEQCMQECHQIQSNRDIDKNGSVYKLAQLKIMILLAMKSKATQNGHLDRGDLVNCKREVRAYMASLGGAEEKAEVEFQAVNVVDVVFTADELMLLSGDNVAIHDQIQEMVRQIKRSLNGGAKVESIRFDCGNTLGSSDMQSAAYKWALFRFTVLSLMQKKAKREVFEEVDISACRGAASQLIEYLAVKEEEEKKRAVASEVNEADLQGVLDEHIRALILETVCLLKAEGVAKNLNEYDRYTAATFEQFVGYLMREKAEKGSIEDPYINCCVNSAQKMLGLSQDPKEDEEEKLQRYEMLEDADLQSVVCDWQTFYKIKGAAGRLQELLQENGNDFDKLSYALLNHDYAEGSYEVAAANFNFDVLALMEAKAKDGITVEMLQACMESANAPALKRDNTKMVGDFVGDMIDDALLRLSGDEEDKKGFGEEVGINGRDRREANLDARESRRGERQELENGLEGIEGALRGEEVRGASPLNNAGNSGGMVLYRPTSEERARREYEIASNAAWRMAINADRLFRRSVADNFAAVRAGRLRLPVFNNPE